MRFFAPFAVITVFLIFFEMVVYGPRIRAYFHNTSDEQIIEE